MNTDSDDHEVGYKKPPKHSQFKKGQSGNPLGRPKKKRTVAEVMNKILHEEVIVKGEKKSKLEILVMSMLKNAIQGKATASKQVLALMEDDEVLEDFSPELDDKIAMMRLQRKVEGQQRKEQS